MDERYKEIYGILTFEVATVIFIKSNGEIRCMLATRNLSTSNLIWENLGTRLAGHDTRCNIKNKNIGVIDLEIGECRSFNVERVVSIYYHGEISDINSLNEIIEVHNDLKARYNADKPRSVGIDDLS